MWLGKKWQTNIIEIVLETVKENASQNEFENIF